MMSDLKVKLSDLINIASLLRGENSSEENSPTDKVWTVGKKYFIRTVTMHTVGELILVTDKELVLKNASWVADSGRFNNALKTGELEEVEPFVNDVIVNRSSLIDATIWDHDLPNQVI